MYNFWKKIIKSGGHNMPMIILYTSILNHISGGTVLVLTVLLLYAMLPKCKHTNPCFLSQKF
jgi:hypothetical protein